MTAPRKTTRRHILRMAGVTAAGASIAACSGGKRGAGVVSGTTSSDTSRSIKLPYLFDGDPQAQESARRLLTAAPSVEDLHTHERFMRLAIDVSDGNSSYPFGAVIVDHKTGDVLGQGVNRSLENPAFHGEIVAINDYATRHRGVGWDRTTLYSGGRAVRDVLWRRGLGRDSACGVGEFYCHHTWVRYPPDRHLCTRGSRTHLRVLPT